MILSLVSVWCDRCRATLSIWWALRTLPCWGPNPSVDRRVRWMRRAPCQPGALRTSISCLPVNVALDGWNTNYKQGSHRPQYSVSLSPALPPGECRAYFKHVIFLSLYTQGHYVQTRPLQPSRPWLQRLLPATSIPMHQVQGCVWAKLPQPIIAMSKKHFIIICNVCYFNLY